MYGRVCGMCHIFYFLEFIKYSMWLLYYQFLEKCLKRSAIFLNGKYFYKSIERINVGLLKDASILCGFSLLESNTEKITLKFPPVF